MRRETREQAIERAGRESASAYLANAALMDALSDTLITIAFGCTGDGLQISAKASRLDAPHGGILVLTTTVRGQRPSVTVYYAECWLTERRAYVPARLDAEAVLYNHIVDELSFAMSKANAALVSRGAHPNH